MSLRAVPLGSGDEVGRSCVVVEVGGRTVMFDCGVHLGFRDEQRYPQYSHISVNNSSVGGIASDIDAVVVTNFQLHRCGGLPHFTESCGESRGYDGPVFMTHPTKALLSIALEDSRKAVAERPGEKESFSREDIRRCMRKVHAVDLNETVDLGGGARLTAFYAGHVVGAAVFLVEANGCSVVYTGDYSMTADRHLGAAALPMLRPNLLITEATYATTVHDSRREREREFLRVVHDTVVARGGKVLIPAYGVGRAQELALILDEYWERMDLKVPIYFSSGSVTKVNVYHKLLLSWASEGGRERGIEKFDLRHMRNFDRSVLDSPGPCVLFAAPAMLHSGLSLEAFVKWAGDHKNTVILPEYCVAGTVGGKLAAGHRSRLEVNSRTRIDVHCAVKCINFSGHADAGGIMRLIRQCSPGSVMLVHGEKDKMNSLRMRIERNIPGIVCHVPSNGTMTEVETGRGVPVHISPKVVSEAAAVAPRIELRRKREREAESPEDVAAAVGSTALQFRPVPAGSRAMHGYMVVSDDSRVAKILAADEIEDVAGPVALSYSCSLPVSRASGSPSTVAERIGGALKKRLSEVDVTVTEECVALRSIRFSVSGTDPASVVASPPHVRCSWLYVDAPLAERCLGILRKTVEL